MKIFFDYLAFFSVIALILTLYENEKAVRGEPWAVTRGACIGSAIIVFLLWISGRWS